MSARGTFNLFLASAAAVLTLSLLNVWGRPEWFNHFPLSYALRFFQAMRAYAASCALFFAILALLKARGRRRREGPRFGALFAACFAPLAVFSALTLTRAELRVMDIFMRADALLAIGCVAAVGGISFFGKREGLPLYSFFFRPEVFSPLSYAETAARYSLSPRESEVLGLLLQGKSNRQIADSLYVSLPTVKTHLAHILEKTGAKNRLEVFARCARPPQPLE